MDTLISTIVDDNMNKLVEVIKKDSSIIIIDKSNKYELNENLILPILNEQDILQLSTSNKILKEFTIQQWVGIVMPIIKRTSAVRSSVAGKEKTLSHFIGISGTPASPVIHFKTKATYSNDYYRTKIQLVDLNKWRQGKYLYSMNNKEFSEILGVCEIRFSCNCKFYHWGGLKYMATELDSSIDKTSIPNPVWRTRKGYSEPSLCKHLKGVLRLIKPNSNKILGLLKDKFSAKFRKENMTSRYERIFNEQRFKPNTIFVYKKLLKLKNNIIGKSADEIVQELNYTFSEYNIIFDCDSIHQSHNSLLNEVGVVEGSYNEATDEINISLNYRDVTEIFEEEYFEDTLYKQFIKAIDLIVAHELIHRDQVNKINYNKIFNVISKIGDPKNKSIWDYMTSDFEIQAFAMQAIKEYRALGYSKNKINNFLRNPINHSNIVESQTMFELFGWINKQEYNEDKNLRIKLNKFLKLAYGYNNE